MKYKRVCEVEGVVESSGSDGGRIWRRLIEPKEGSWVPQQAFRSTASMLTCRMTPCTQPRRHVRPSTHAGVVLGDPPTLAIAIPVDLILLHAHVDPHSRIRLDEAITTVFDVLHFFPCQSSLKLNVGRFERRMRGETPGQGGEGHRVEDSG